MTPAKSDNLGAFAVFGGVLAAAGLPIYIFAPPFFAENFGVGLTAMAVVLFWLRLIDAIQDPLFGWISERLGRWRALSVAGVGLLMAAAMFAVFGIEPPFAPIVWFALTLLILFSAFSFLTINFYAQGVVKAQSIKGGHLRVAAWRETGALIGICCAAVAPAVLALVFDEPYFGFAVAFAIVVVIAIFAMSREWNGPVKVEKTKLSQLLGNATIRRLLLLALVNATPVAVSSTLFLFFVVHRLGAQGWEGPLLVLFFLSGAIAAPFWGKLANLWGTRKTLLAAMLLAIVSFATAVFLSDGDVIFFAIVCIASGATIGADLTLLPAMFATHVARTFPNAGQSFGLWAFVNKVTLAFAAVVLFPILEGSGFNATLEQQTPAALMTLTTLYALVPLALKLLAFCFLFANRFEEIET